MYAPIETYRGVVYPWMIDHVGHMNVQFYTARFDEASWHFLARLGLTPAFLNQNRLAGSLVHIATELLALGRTSIRFVHRMYDSETGEAVAESELVGVYLDTDIRSATQLPPLVRQRADELRIGPGGRDTSREESTPAELTPVT